MVVLEAYRPIEGAEIIQLTQERGAIPSVVVEVVGNGNNIVIIVDDGMSITLQDEMNKLFSTQVNAGLATLDQKGICILFVRPEPPIQPETENQKAAVALTCVEQVLRLIEGIRTPVKNQPTTKHPLPEGLIKEGDRLIAVIADGLYAYSNPVVDGYNLLKEALTSDGLDDILYKYSYGANELQPKEYSKHTPNALQMCLLSIARELL